MTSSDTVLIAKKILVGVLITVVPLLIVSGALYLTQSLLQTTR